MSRTVKKRRPKNDPKKESNAIDAFLLQRDLERKPVAKDGSCLFRAVAEQAWLTQARHEELRVLCAYHIRKYPEYFQSFLTIPVDQYSFHLVEPKLWGGEIELVALAQLLEIKILVYSYNEEKKGKVEEMVFKGANVKESEPVRLAYFDKNHYDSVWSLKEKKATAMCQSIVYEVLMEKVLKEKLSKTSRQHLNTITEEKLTSLSIPSDTLQLTHRFTDEVVQALAPFVYRNTPLHVEWRERQSREQTDRHVAAQMQFQVGQSCLAHVGGKVYHGLIKGVDTGKTDSDSKNAQVHIQEKNAIWSVSYKNIVLNHSPYNTRKREEFQRPATKRGTPKYQQQKDKHHSSAVDTTNHPTKPSSHYTTVSASSTATVETVKGGSAVQTVKGGSAVQNSRDASLAKGLLGECPKEFEPQQLMQQVQTHKQQRQWLAEKQPHVQQSHQQSTQRPQSSATPQTFKAAVIGGSNNSSSARGPSRNTNGPLNSSLVVKPTSSSTLKAPKETPLQSSNLTPGTSLPASVTNRGDTTSNKRLQQEFVANKNTSSMPWSNKGKPYSAVSNGSVAHSDGGSTPSSSSDECATSPHDKMAPLHIPVHHQSVGHHTDPAGQPSRSQQHVSQRLLPQSLAGTSLLSGGQNQLPETRSSITEAATYDPIDPSVGLPATSHTSSMVVPPLLHPHQPHSSLDETSRFLNSTAYMNSLIGRPYPEILTQKQLSAITDAPESEWPNLTAEDLKAAAYAQSGTCSFIDGPPAGTAASENVNSQVMGFQMPMLFPQGHQLMYILMNEMSPPLHLLECNTHEARRQFMFEYAQKCLRVYSKYMNDSELEDKLNDLLCMDLEEFSASISESQLSVSTSCTSRAESEVIDDYNGFTSVVSYSRHTDSHVPLYKREEEQSKPEIGGGARTAEDEDKVSDNVHPRKLNTEEENYLSSLQQISSNNLMPTSAELTVLEETVPSPVGMSTAEEDSPLSDTVALSNDVNHTTPPPPPSSYPQSVPEEKTNDDQEEEDKPSLHPPMGPSMFPHMMGPPHPLMVPRLPPPYFMPYYYPPYGFPPGPWPGYIHPMMFPPMPVVPVPTSPQQPQEDKNVVDSSSDNEQSNPIEVHVTESSPSNTLVTNDIVTEKEGLSTDGSSTELQDGSSKFQPSTSLLPNSQSSDVSVHQPSPPPQQSSSQEFLPQHQLPQQNDRTKAPSSVHIPPKDNAASTHKTSYRYYKKPRSTGAPSKKEHPVESERSAVENKATIVIKENPKRERDAEKTTKGNSSADSISEPIPRALPISSQDNLEKLGSKNDEKGTESSNQQTTSRQTHRYNNQHGQYGGRQQHGYYRPFRRHNYSNRTRGSYADNRTRTDATSHQEDGSSKTTSATSHSNQDGSRYQGKRQEKQQSNDRVPRDSGPTTTVHESRPQGGASGGFRKSQKHTQQSTSGKFSKDATVRGIETYQPSHSPSVCLPFTSTYSWPDISSPGSSLKSPTMLTSLVTCTEESASVSMPSGLEPVLFGNPKAESHRKHCV